MEIAIEIETFTADRGIYSERRKHAQMRVLDRINDFTCSHSILKLKPGFKMGLRFGWFHVNINANIYKCPLCIVILSDTASHIHRNHLIRLWLREQTSNNNNSTYNTLYIKLRIYIYTNSSHAAHFVCIMPNIFGGDYSPLYNKSVAPD